LTQPPHTGYEKAAMSSCVVPPHHRLYRLNQALHSGKKLTAQSLASELGVSERTIKRTIQYMREELGMEIIWEPNSKSYFCDRDSEKLPLLRVTGEEALSLSLATRTFAAWQGSSLGNALQSVLEKLAVVVGGAISMPVSNLHELISVPNPDTSESSEYRWFAPALEAIRQRRIIELRYKKPNAPASESRHIWPLHLALLEHHWALISWDPVIAEPRKFLLSRIEQLDSTDAQYNPPPSFDLKSYLSHSFGLFTSEQIHHVRVHFSAYAAAYLRERQWHPSQMLEELPDGSAIASFQVNHLLDIQRWILSWGIHAEALEPPGLRHDLQSITSDLANRYTTHE
jgi:predicted DNA-binding transcriptional regulator YafY